MRRYRLPLLMSMTTLAFAQQLQDNDGPPDEAGRAVARVSVLSGDASVRRGDTGEWVSAALNAPLLGGDAVSVSPGSAAEFQLSGASFARLAGDSEVRIAEFDNGRIQLQLAKGLVTYRVLRQTSEEAEINTPLASIHPLGLASVRVETAPDGSTHVLVRHGEVEVSTHRGTERVREGSMMVIKGSADDPEFQVYAAPAHDRWDTWSDQRDAYLLRAQSPRYVSQDVYGTEDLDNYGRWSNDPAYGNVWTPTVAAGWAPYRDGRWVWEDYYGWTWIDASPWGWAPFHYGSWYQRAGYGWSWFPGRQSDRYWYRPALVGFFGFGGGGGFGPGVGFGNIGWIPLAPYERYHPWYGRGLGGGRNAGFNNINIVNNTNITNVYRNSRFVNGVTAVSGSDFQRGNYRNRVSVDNNNLQQASLVRGMVPVSPGNDHLRFSDRPTASGLRAGAGNQRFFGRQPSNPAGSERVPFNQQQTSVRSAFESRGMQVGGEPQVRQNSSPGWQRFGNPRSTERQAPADRQFSAPAQRNQSPGSESRFNGSRFDSTPRDQGRSQQDRSQQDRSQQGRSQQERSLDVAPPIVRERQSQPTYNPPVYRQPVERAPQYDRGGFGSPTYRTPPAAQAPRSSPGPTFRNDQSGGERGNRGGGGNAGGGNPGGGGANMGGGNRTESGGNSGSRGGRR